MAKKFVIGSQCYDESPFRIFNIITNSCRLQKEFSNPQKSCYHSVGYKHVDKECSLFEEYAIKLFSKKELCLQDNKAQVINSLANTQNKDFKIEFSHSICHLPSFAVKTSRCSCHRDIIISSSSICCCGYCSGGFCFCWIFSAA